MTDPVEIEAALRLVMEWRETVIENRGGIMAIFDDDASPTKVAAALFKGPVWEAAEAALLGKH